MRRCDPEPETLRLDLEGMTCASCAARIERGLNRLDGVEATVNFATEQATVRCDRRRCRVDELVGAVEAAGYRAALPARRGRDARHDEPGAVRRAARSSRRCSRCRSSLLAMVPPLQFARLGVGRARALDAGRLLVAAPAFHRAALGTPRARRRDDGHADLDRHARRLDRGRRSCSSRGIDARHLLRGRRGDHDADPARPLPRGARAAPLGRGDPALLELGAKEARVLRDGERGARPGRASSRPGDRFVVRPGEKIATDGVVVEGASAVDQSLLTGESVPVEVGPGSEVAGRDGQHLRAGSSSARRRVGADTALAQIARLVEEAQSGKAPVQRLADRVSAVFVPVVIGALARDARRLARLRRVGLGRVHGGGRGADHRLPVRARPRDADRADGRHRPRARSSGS